MKLLIVNADDFGYSPSINKGILEAHVKGIVTSTSVMVDSVAAEDAKNLYEYRDLSVGLHFVPESDGAYQQQIDRQIKIFTSITGKYPSHIDIHKVRHDDTALKNAVNDYAASHNLQARYSGRTNFINSFFGPHAGGDVSIAQLIKSLSEITEGINELMCHVGYSDDYLRTHSSYNDTRENELKSICDPEVKDYIANNNIKLITWEQQSWPSGSSR